MFIMKDFNILSSLKEHFTFIFHAIKRVEMRGGEGSGSMTKSIDTQFICIC